MSNSIHHSRSPYASHWDPLKVYSFYRVLLSVLLFGIFFIDLKSPQIGGHNAKLYLLTDLSYSAISLITLISLYLKKHISNLFTFGIVCSDILFITGLAHASGGISSHLSILLVVSVAAGGILISGQIATLIAAVATMAILYEHFYFVLIGKINEDASSVQAALLGVVFFATSLLAQLIASRLRTSEKLMAQTTRELAELENLNYHIIQRMRTGILVIDRYFKILTLNAAAKDMLGLAETAEHGILTEVCPLLASQVQRWMQNRNTFNPPLKITATSPEISAHMADLTSVNHVLIFLDDTSRMTQKAQQLKLASLGQLTAAIAHEIRNPLGAISHAAQLLAESTSLPTADARLTEIIQDHSKRVNQIIENILELSRRRPAAVEPLDLIDWLDKLLSDYASNTIQIQMMQPEVKIRFDPSQLRQVLHNLLDNALRYSQATNNNHHAQVLLRIGEDEVSESIFLEVIDNGPGISPSNANHLFEPFFTTETKGTGLGLYICRELCQANYARLDYIPAEPNRLTQHSIPAEPGSLEQGSLKQLHKQNPEPIGDSYLPGTYTSRTHFQGACFRITFAHPDRVLTQ